MGAYSKWQVVDASVTTNYEPRSGLFWWSQALSMTSTRLKKVDYSVQVWIQTKLARFVHDWLEKCSKALIQILVRVALQVNPWKSFGSDFGYAL